MKTIRMAQYGTRHAHAVGKVTAMCKNPEVNFAGIYESDTERRLEAQSSKLFPDCRWFESEDELLRDTSIQAVTSEGSNAESLDQTAKLIQSGKHVLYDKPAGEDMQKWRDVVSDAQSRQLHLQMGYMFRYHDGFSRIIEWARSGFLGSIFSIRAQMSTCIPPESRKIISAHRGGIFYELAGHMLDQILWMLGPPMDVIPVFRHHDIPIPGFIDNTMCLMEYSHALAVVQISAMEARPNARRIEVHGTKGSVIMEPFEPAHEIRLNLVAPDGEFKAGENIIPLLGMSRSEQYDRELEAFIRVIRDEQDPDRPVQHELLVQEVLLRATGAIE